MSELSTPTYSNETLCTFIGCGSFILNEPVLKFMFQAQEVLDAADPLEMTEEGEKYSDQCRTASDLGAAGAADAVVSAQCSITALRMVLAGQQDNERAIIEAFVEAVDALSLCGFGPKVLDQQRAKSIPNYSFYQSIIPGILCGGEAPLRSGGFDLQDIGVTHVLSIVSASASRAPLALSWLPKVKHRVIVVDDSEHASMKPYFGDITAFISGVKFAGGKIYVHSLAGISRAPAAVASYLMLAGGLSFAEALSVVRRGRCCSRPNPALLKQLQGWERDILEKRTFVASNKKEVALNLHTRSVAADGGLGARGDRATLRQKQTVPRRSVRNK